MLFKHLFMQNIFLKRVCCICWLLAVMGPLRAQFEEGQASSQLNSMSCTQALPSVPNSVTYAAQGAVLRKIRNIVRLKINEQALNGAAGSPFLFFKSGFTATATLKVELWSLAANGGNAPDQTQTQIGMTPHRHASRLLDGGYLELEGHLVRPTRSPPVCNAAFQLMPRCVRFTVARLRSRSCGF